MNPPAASDWTTLRRIFEGAVEVPAAARPAFLDGACADHPELRREVEELLVAHDRAEAGDALSGPFDLAAPFGGRGGLRPARETTEAESAEVGRLGEVLGGYRLLEIVGRGGMGVVYRAEQVDPPLGRRAAVKLLRGDYRPDELRRFEEEQRILARLEHPNIARLFATGVTPDGLPFLVMEFVDGVDLRRHCAEHRLSIPQRLELFEAICQAVQVAHNNLVVHRDLKPTNLLVDREGRPRVLDFGIAKRLDEGADAGLLTRTGHYLLTPEYASPEQFSGEPITTLSDVYTLGVVLFELLTGKRPRSLESLSPAEAERVVCTTPPPRPSAVGSAEGRRLSGDLDVVVTTAMALEPDRRYASATELALDLRRYRLGQPILARPDALTYRLGKFARRNRGPLAAAVVVVIALLAGVVMTARQASETERRFEQVRDLTNTLLFDIQEEIRDTPGVTRLRERLVARSTTHLEGLAADASRDRALLADLAAAHEQLGELRGDPRFASLGDLEGAIASYREAERIRRGLLAANPEDGEALRAHAAVSLRLAAALSWNGDNASAITVSGDALACLETLAVTEPRRGDLVFEEARARAEHGWYRIWAGELEAGMADVARASGRLDSLLAARDRGVAAQEQDGADLELRLARIDATLYLADGLEFDGRYAEMAEVLEREMQALAILALEHPTHVRVRRKQLACLKQLGEALEWVDPKAALAIHREAVVVAEAQVRIDGDNFATRRSLASAYANLGGLLYDQGRPAESAEALERAVAEQREMFAQDVSNHNDGANLATSLMWQSQAFTELDRHDRAIATAEAAIEVRETIGAQLHGDAANLGNLASAHGALGAAWLGRAVAAPSLDAATVAAPVVDREQSLVVARAAYGRGLSLFEDLARSGRFMEYWTPARDACRRGVAVTDSLLRFVSPAR